jgi:hypothetical protein
MYNFFNKYLGLGQTETITEKPFNPVLPKDLAVYDKEHPLPKDAANAATLRKTMTEAQEKQLQALLPRDKPTLAQFETIERGALRAIMTDQLPAASEVEVVSSSGPMEKDGIKTIDVVLSRKGRGERVRAQIVRGKEFDGRGVVWVHPEGIASLRKEGQLVPAARQILDQGSALLAVEPFRTGAMAKEPPAGNLKIASLGDAGYFFGYNRSLVAERVHDILTAVVYARSNDKVTSLHLVGFEQAGPWVILASGLCGNAVVRTAADVNQFNFEQVKELDDEMMLPGALKYGGLLTLAATIAPRELYLHNANGAGTTAHLEAAYTVAGVQNLLKRQEAKAEPKQVVTWLLR